jgi:Flp pilus assembly protein TadB
VLSYEYLYRGRLYLQDDAYCEENEKLKGRLEGLIAAIKQIRFLIILHCLVCIIISVVVNTLLTIYISILLYSLHCSWSYQHMRQRHSAHDIVIIIAIVTINKRRGVAAAHVISFAQSALNMLVKCSRNIIKHWSYKLLLADM